MSKDQEKHPVAVSIAGGVEAFRTRVTDLRCALGMKQHDLAKSTGMSRTKLSDMLWGKEIVTRKDADALATALGVPPDRLTKRPKPGVEREGPLGDQKPAKEQEGILPGESLPEWVRYNVRVIGERLLRSGGEGWTVCPYCGENVPGPVRVTYREDVLQCVRCGLCVPVTGKGKLSRRGIVRTVLAALFKGMFDEEKRKACAQCRWWLACGIRVTKEGKVLR